MTWSIRKRAATSFPIAMALFLVSTATAYAEGTTWGDNGGKNETTANTDDQTVSTAVTTQVKITKNTSQPSGEVISPVGTDWDPPQCWYEPVATPKELKKAVEGIDGSSSGSIPVTPHLSWGAIIMKDRYGQKNDLSKYGDYNISRQGKGKWYRGATNPAVNSADWDLNAMCDDIMFWVPDGSAPAKPQMVSPKILAGYAYSMVRVPDTKVELNPEGKSTVNLATWMWLDKADFKPITVRAELGGTGLWAEATAKPVSLHLDPGTKDAVLHPESGECKISDGRIGVPYTKGHSDETPPCGVTYKRSTSSTGPYELQATVTWEISWAGSNGTGGDLPDGAFKSTQDVVVQEVQSVVR